MESLKIGKMYAQKSHPNVVAVLEDILQRGMDEISIVKIRLKDGKRYDLGLISFKRNWRLL